MTETLQEILSARVTARKVALPSPQPEAAGLTVLIIDDELGTGRNVRDVLRDDGHIVHVRTQNDAIIEEVAFLRPQVVVLHLQANVPGALALAQALRARFEDILFIVYTDTCVQTVRSELNPHLVLSTGSPITFALQTRCWARHVAATFGESRCA